MPGSFATAKTCITCKKFCHQKCLVDDTVCVVCHQQEQIYFQRQGAKRKEEEQANKMLERSAKRFKEAEVGDTVLVPIPDLDRGRCDYPNLKAIVLEKHPNGTLWKLGCRSGILDQ